MQVHFLLPASVARCKQALTQEVCENLTSKIRHLSNSHTPLLRPANIADVMSTSRHQTRHNRVGGLVSGAFGDPPFEEVKALVLKAKTLIDPEASVAMLLSLSFKATGGRTEFWDQTPAAELVLDERPDFNRERRREC